MSKTGESDYNESLKKREATEVEMNNAYELAHALQDKYNDLDRDIQAYEREQAALDE